MGVLRQVVLQGKGPESCLVACQLPSARLRKVFVLPPFSSSSCNPGVIRREFSRIGKPFNFWSHSHPPFSPIPVLTFWGCVFMQSPPPSVRSHCIQRVLSIWRCCLELSQAQLMVDKCLSSVVLFFAHNFFLNSFFFVEPTFFCRTTRVT